MFRALLVHPQVALHESRIGDYCAQLQMWVGLISTDQTTPTTAHNIHQFCVRVVLPEDEQVMPETCRDIDHQRRVCESDVCIKLVVLLRKYDNGSSVQLH
jgi:hypothetical protein